MKRTSTSHIEKSVLAEKSGKKYYNLLKRSLKVFITHKFKSEKLSHDKKDILLNKILLRIKKWLELTDVWWWYFSLLKRTLPYWFEINGNFMYFYCNKDQTSYYTINLDDPNDNGTYINWSNSNSERVTELHQEIDDIMTTMN